jgi:beta-lactamase regulating signal transducer with metallopeptidase domain
LIACIAGAWLGVVILAFARLLQAVRLVGDVKRRSLRVDETLQRSLTLWSAARGRGRVAELRVSNELSGACALGLSDPPVILVSTRLIAALDADQLDQIVMHEHAHLARYDDWLRMIQSMVMALCGLHPAVQFISARIDLEREAACDDRVVSQTGAAERYASCLANAADLGRRRQALSLEPVLAPHASQSRGALVTRVRRLLDPRLNRDAHLKWASTALSILAFATAVLISPAAQPLVVVIGALSGEPQLQVSAAGGRTAWRSAAFAPAWPAAVDALPAAWDPDLTGRSDPVVPSPVLSDAPRQISFARQLSWTMPGQLTVVATLPAEPSRPLPAMPVQPWSIANTGAVPPAPSPTPAPEPAGDSAWKAAGASGAAVGTSVARAGIATGSSSRKAGTAVAGFFSRAGKAVAGGF